MAAWLGERIRFERDLWTAAAIGDEWRLGQADLAAAMDADIETAMRSFMWRGRARGLGADVEAHGHEILTEFYDRCDHALCELAAIRERSGEPAAERWRAGFIRNLRALYREAATLDLDHADAAAGHA